jgi:hypothetical protein
MLKIVVVFRLVVFRPFASEVIVGKVKSSDEDGIRRASIAFLESTERPDNSLPPVTVGFFDDIYIPTAYLPQPSALFVPPFSISLYLLALLTPFLYMTATQTSAHTFGCQIPRSQTHMKCSTRCSLKGCTLTKARSFAYGLKQTSFTILNRARQKRWRVWWLNMNRKGLHMLSLCVPPSLPSCLDGILIGGLVCSVRLRNKVLGLWSGGKVPRCKSENKTREVLALVVVAHVLYVLLLCACMYVSLFVFSELDFIIRAAVRSTNSIDIATVVMKRTCSQPYAILILAARMTWDPRFSSHREMFLLWEFIFIGL